jgi:predicted RNase H-like HicB family nuclease
MGFVNDIVFQVAEDEDGTYCASWDHPRGGGISTQGSDLAELQAMVRDAVLCHFDEGEVPERVRLHFATTEADPVVVALLNDRWERYELGEMPARSWDQIRSEIRRS